MFRKDYLQRQFETFGKVLSVILGYKGKKDWDEFEKALNAASEQFNEKRLSFYEDLSDAAFEEILVSDQGIEEEKKKILATLLFEKLNYYQSKGDHAQFEKLGKRCLAIYSNLKENQLGTEFDLDIHYKISALQQLGFN